MDAGVVMETRYEAGITFCQLQVRYLMVFSDSISIWRPMLSVVEEASTAVTLCWDKRRPWP